MANHTTIFAKKATKWGHEESELRKWKINGVARTHTGGKFQSWDWNPGVLDSIGSPLGQEFSAFFDILDPLGTFG